MPETGERGHVMRDDAGLRKQRAQQDRRSGVDRRSVRACTRSAHYEIRAYGFRDFSERRRCQDRRLYCHESQAGADPFVHVTREDLLAVLSIISVR